MRSETLKKKYLKRISKTFVVSEMTASSIFPKTFVKNDFWRASDFEVIHVFFSNASS